MDTDDRSTASAMTADRAAGEPADDRRTAPLDPAHVYAADEAHEAVAAPDADLGDNAHDDDDQDEDDAEDGTEAEGDVCCPICKHWLCVGSDEMCEHYLCIRNDDGGNFIWFNRGATDFDDAVTALAQRIDELRGEDARTYDRILAAVTAEQRALFERVADDREYWAEDKGVAEEYYETGGFPASGVVCYFHPDPLAFSARVLTRAEAALATLESACEHVGDPPCPFCQAAVDPDSGAYCAHYRCSGSGGELVAPAYGLGYIAEALETALTVVQAIEDSEYFSLQNYRFADICSVYLQEKPPIAVGTAIAAAEEEDWSRWMSDPQVIAVDWERPDGQGDDACYFHPDAPIYAASVAAELRASIDWLRALAVRARHHATLAGAYCPICDRVQCEHLLCRDDDRLLLAGGAPGRLSEALRHLSAGEFAALLAVVPSDLRTLLTAAQRGGEDFWVADEEVATVTSECGLLGSTAYYHPNAARFEQSLREDVESVLAWQARHAPPDAVGKPDGCCVATERAAARSRKGKGQ